MATPTKVPEAVLDLVGDKATARDGQGVVVRVLGNDTVKLADGSTGELRKLLEADGFSVAVDIPPAFGEAEVDGDTIVYTSKPGYGGEDEFTYRVDVRGGKAKSETELVTIQVKKS
ncbi:Ig-like domain-containing protein [Streptomyces sp. NPDC055078]